MTDMHMLATGYLDRLAALGPRPEDVDYVLFTHLHPVHVGWNTRLDAERWTPTFPNARYLVSRAEYEAEERDASADAPVAIRNAFRDSVRPIMDAGLLDLVEGSHGIPSGFAFRPAPGHTPGHVRIELRSGDETGVFAGDVLHSPLQIPLWHMSSKYCADHELATRSRLESVSLF